MDDTGIEPRKVAYKTDGKWQVTESELHFWWHRYTASYIHDTEKKKYVILMSFLPFISQLMHYLHYLQYIRIKRNSSYCYCKEDRSSRFPFRSVRGRDLIVCLCTITR